MNSSMPSTVQVGHSADVRGGAGGRRWLAQRWGRLVAVGVGLLFLLAAVTEPWLSVSTFVADPWGTPAILRADYADTPLLDARPWGPLFAATAAIAVVATLAAVITRHRHASGIAGIVAGAAALVGLGTAGAAWARIWPEHDDAAARILDLVDALGFTAPLDPSQEISFRVDARGAGYGVLALVVLGLVAATSIRPDRGVVLAAGAGTVLTLPLVVVPYYIVHRIAEDEVTLAPVWWPALGAPAAAAVASIVVAVALVWWSVARPVAPSRHVRLVATLVLVAVMVVAPEMVTADGENSPLMTEGLLTVEPVAASLPEHLAILGMFVLAVAAVQSWRRGRASGTPSGRPVG